MPGEESYQAVPHFRNMSHFNGFPCSLLTGLGSRISPCLCQRTGHEVIFKVRIQRRHNISVTVSCNWDDKYNLHGGGSIKTRMC